MRAATVQEYGALLCLRFIRVCGGAASVDEVLKCVANMYYRPAEYAPDGSESWIR